MDGTEAGRGVARESDVGLDENALAENEDADVGWT
jgi:hypothetical protein